MKLRQIALTLHRYIGVAMGLLTIAIALSGSVLVFHKEIDRFLNPDLFHVIPQGARASLQSVIETIRSTYPDLKIYYINLPLKPDDVYQAVIESKIADFMYIYLNPYTGTILGEQQWGHTLITLVYQFHYTLLAGEIGSKIVGICGLLLLLLSATGLILWPGWKKFSKSFKIRWHSPAPLLNYDIHKVVGILSVAFLVLMSATGAALIFHDEFERTVHWFTRPPELPEPTSTLIANAPPISMNDIIQKADSALPGAKTTYIYWPQTPNDVFSVAKKFPQDISPNGESKVYIDQYSGDVIKVEKFLEHPLATQITNAMFPLHIGVYGGSITRIIHALIGAVPIVLLITGLRQWRHRQWAKARSLEASRQPSDLSPIASWPWF